jgi:hypothetical protein
MRPPGGRTRRDSAPTPEKRHSRGESRRARKGLSRIGGREHAAHEPLIVAEVPLAGLFIAIFPEYLAFDGEDVAKLAVPGASGRKANLRSST